MAAATALGGCDTIGNFKNGWFAPNELGRFEKQPLMMPIVTSLDTGVEEPNDQFQNATDVSPADLVAANQDYVIGKNDLLSISITDLVAPGVETVKSARVSESGNISLPLVGQIRAEGLSEAQLETEIQRAYREANLMPNAQVSVTVQQALARTFSILGSVQRPNQYVITQTDFRILDALVTSGDVSSQGIDYLYVIRRENTAGPATLPALGAPATTPTPPPGDVLTPRTQGNLPADIKNVALLVQDAAAPAASAPTANAPTAAPAAAPAAPAAPGTGEGHYIVVDGKPVLVGNQGATADPAGPAPTAPPGTPVAPAEPAPMAVAPTTQGFEFNGPGGAGAQKIIRVPVNQLKNGELKYNIVIRPLDMIIVPPPLTGEYYMDGHVNRGGVYSLTARDITLKQAIAAAGGLDALAVPASHTDIIRRIGKDREVFARVNLDKVFAGQQPDIYLKPNDVVRVGTNAFMPFVAAFRNAFRITYGFGFLYDRNYAPQNNSNNN